MVRALLQHPLIDPNKAMGGYPETALYYAADHAEIDYVRLLIYNHINHKAWLDTNPTPLEATIQEAAY